MEMLVLGFSKGTPPAPLCLCQALGPPRPGSSPAVRQQREVRLLTRLALSGTPSTSNSAFSPSPWTPLSFPCHRARQNWELEMGQGVVNISDALGWQVGTGLVGARHKQTKGT